MNFRGILHANRKPSGKLIGFAVFIFIVLITALMVSPLWHQQGMPGAGSDMLLHVHRAAAMTRAFEQGVFWPRWFPIAYQGLGAPVFHHYSPGFYWLVAATHLSGIRLDESLKVVITVAFILSGVGTYAWLRRTFSVQASLIGVALYLAQPHFLLRGFYYLGDYPQMLGLLLIPVCLWAFDALHSKSYPWYWLSAVGSLAALVFIHNFMAIMGAVVLLSFWLMLAILYRRPGSLLRCALAALAAAALSASFWLPAVADLPLVQIDEARTGYFAVGEHFLRVRELLALPPVFLDSRAGNPLMIPTFNFGAPQLLAVVAGLLGSIFVKRRELRFWGISSGLLALAVLTLTLPASELLWHTIPGFGFLQFPFRLLPIATLGAVAAGAAATDMWPAKGRWVPTLAMLICSTLIPFPYLFPGLVSITVTLPVEALTVEESSRFERTFGAWGFAGSREFLVQGAGMGVIKGEVPEPDAAILSWLSPHEAVADLSEQPDPMLLRLHFHPGWSADERAKLTRGPVGWTEVTDLNRPDLPLVVRWEGTVWQHRGNQLGRIGLLATGGGFLFFAFRRRQDGWKEGRHDEKETFSLLVPAMVGFLLALVAVRYLPNWSAGGPYLWHSPPGQVPFAAEGQPITLGDTKTGQMTLLGWKLLSGSKPRPGDTIVVRYYWQVRQHFDNNLHTILHLYTPSIQRSWATESEGALRPPTRAWGPASYYIETMRLTLPTDIPPITYSLVSGLSSSSAERLSVPGSTDGLLQLREMSVEPLRPGLLQRVRPTTGASADTDDGLHLQGYDLLDEPAGHSLRLFWETGEGVASDWITYIHMTDPQGELVAQFDGAPLAGLLPTSQWKSNSLYIDRRKLEVPSSIAPGDYLLRIGLYSFESGERLAFQPEDGEQGHFESGQLLAPIRVHDGKSCYICSGDQ